MQSLRPPVRPSRHFQSGSRVLFGFHQRIHAIRALSKGGGGSFIGGGGGGLGGSGDDGYGDFEDSSLNFNVVSLLTFISKQNNFVHSIAEFAEQEQENLQEQENSDEEEVYVKPAPKPKAEKISLGPISSIVVLLFLLSSGFFLWKKSRKRSSPSITEEVLIQRTREINLSPESQEEEQGEEQDEQESFLITDLERKDELFSSDRNESTIPSELMKWQQQENLERTESSEEKESEENYSIEQKQQMKVQNLAEGLEFVKPVPVTTEQYYAHLEAKDSFFNTVLTTEFPKEEISETEFQKIETPTAEFLKTPNCETTAGLNSSPAHQEVPATEQDDEGPSTRSTIPPISNNEEGPNQSSGDSDLLIKDSETEEKKPPQKYPLIEEELDLGPPIKPKGIDFTKDWEHDEEGMFLGKTGKIPIDEKTHNMAYLLSRPSLLAEVVKQLESKPQSKNGKVETENSQIPDSAKGVSGSLQSKKKKRGKKGRR
eukprot:g8458.t1